MEDPSNIHPFNQYAPDQLDRVDPLDQINVDVNVALSGPSPTILLADAAHELGEWIGAVLVNIDDSLARIGDSDWRGGTREIVLRAIGAEAVRQFVEHGPPHLNANCLERAATEHLAQYAIAQSLATMVRRTASDGA